MRDILIGPTAILDWMARRLVLECISERMDLPAKEVFVLSIDAPNTPKYYVYSEKVAKDLEEKLLRTYGQPLKVEKIVREM